jgi:hypothetical protein
MTYSHPGLEIRECTENGLHRIYFTNADGKVAIIWNMSDNGKWKLIEPVCRVSPPLFDTFEEVCAEYDRRLERIKALDNGLPSSYNTSMNDTLALINSSNLEDLKRLITITESDTDVSVKLGWRTIATISEDDGLWYLDGGGEDGPTSVGGYRTKQAALAAVVKFYEDA